jgi:ketosteroid isomerase-like protein
MLTFKTFASVVFLLLAFAIPCAAQSQRERMRAEADIRAVISAQAAAWNRGDLEGFMAGYWSSDQLAFVSGDRVTRGWNATLDNYKRSYPTREKMGVLTFSGLEISILSRDAAVVLGSWSLAREADNPKGKFTIIFRKLNGRWLIVHDHSS